MKDIILILHPKMLYDTRATFYKGVGIKDRIHIYKYMKNEDREKTIEKIRKYLISRSKKLPKIIANDQFLNHQLVTSEKDISKYLIGIICNKCDNNDIKKYKKLLKMIIYISRQIMTPFLK